MRRTYLLTLAFSAILASSCARSLTDDGFRKATGNRGEPDAQLFEEGETYGSNLGSTWKRGLTDDTWNQEYNGFPDKYRQTRGLSKEVIQFNREKVKIHDLRYKRNIYPSKRDKYDHLLVQEEEKMSQRRDLRTQERTAFLQQFYADLYQLSGDKFTKKYKSHCYEKLLTAMKNLYRDSHPDKQGYMWAIFGDNRMHTPQDVTVTHLTIDNSKHLQKEHLDFMVGDTINLVPAKYAYITYDQRWYEIMLGTSRIMVEMAGTGKDITITGLVNPMYNIAIK